MNNDTPINNAGGGTPMSAGNGPMSNSSGNGGMGTQQNRMDLQQAKQILNQFNIEAAAAKQLGEHTEEGKIRKQNANKLRAILVSYSEKQKLLEQQQKQKQAQQQQSSLALSQGNNMTSAPVSSSSGLQMNMNSPMNSNISTAHSSSQDLRNLSPQVQNLQNHQQNLLKQQQMVSNSQGTSPQLVRSISGVNDTSTPNNASLTPGASAASPMTQQLTTAQQLQLTKQKLLSKYQQITNMAEQFKKNLIMIQTKLADPAVDDKIKAQLTDKEKEINARLENCKKCTQQIATQLKIAQQQAHKIAAAQQQQQKRANSNPTSNSTNTSGPHMTRQQPSGSLGQVSTPIGSNGNSMNGGAPVSKKDDKKLSEGKRASSSNDITGSNKRQQINAPMSSGVETTETKFSNPEIPSKLNVSNNEVVSIQLNNRPTMLGGNAIGASALSNPISTKIQEFEIEGERVLNKRKLKELVSSIANEEGDLDINIDGDVEELLLDLADEFVTSVTSFASKLARHRNSDNLDVRDVQLHLERNWNIRIPGYASDEIRMIRKFVSNNAHNSKVNGVFINKSVNKNDPN